MLSGAANANATLKSIIGSATLTWGACDDAKEEWV